MDYCRAARRFFPPSRKRTSAVETVTAPRPYLVHYDLCKMKGFPGIVPLDDLNDISLLGKVSRLKRQFPLWNALKK